MFLDFTHIRGRLRGNWDRLNFGLWGRFQILHLFILL